MTGNATPVSYTHLGDKGGGHEQSADAFTGQHCSDNAHEHLVDVCHGAEVDGFLCQLHFSQAKLFAGDDSKEGGEGHQTQTAHLDQQDNDDLPKPAPVRKGIIGCLLYTSRCV